MKNPAISIIMATYNRAHFIGETLQSILNQTFVNFECLVIDDGGIDNTAQVISDIVGEDFRFKYLQRNNKYLKGLPGCRNMGLDLALGEFVVFFDDDDIVHPLNLELCFKNLKSTNYDFCRYERDIFYNSFEGCFDLSKNFSHFIIESNQLEAMLKGTLPFNSCAVMWKKTCFDNVKFNEKLMYAEEWECYSRILSSGKTGISLNKTLFFGRKHIKSNTGEYFSGTRIRVLSKKKAIVLIAEDLKEKELLSDNIQHFLLSQSIAFRDIKLLKKLLNIKATRVINYYIRYITYPIWKLTKSKFK